MFICCGDPQQRSVRYSFGGKHCLILQVLQVLVDDALALDRGYVLWIWRQSGDRGPLSRVSPHLSILITFPFNSARPGHRISMKTYPCVPKTSSSTGNTASTSRVPRAIRSTVEMFSYKKVYVCTKYAPCQNFRRSSRFNGDLFWLFQILWLDNLNHE